MPESLLERIVASAMLISAALLIFLVVRETTRSDEPRAAATVAGVLATTSPATTRATPAKSAARPRPAAKAAPAQPPTRLLLLASGGDSWLTVRAGSAQGKVLYTGTLARESEVDVKAKQLWVRFGAASHLTARLNGKPLPLRLGTYSALISPDGLQLVPG